MLKINNSIFKSYDIRGIYPQEINEEVAFLIGQALVKYLKAKKVVVGRDARQSSPQLHKALIKGIISQGIRVIDLGLVPSELIYFAVGRKGYDGGAMVTASHNHKKYNGIRIVNKRVEMQPGKKLLSFIKHQANFPIKAGGGVESKNLLGEYIQHVLSFIDKTRIKPLKVVIDAGNGVAGLAITELFKHLPCQLIPLFFEPDGRFPNRPSNPLLPEAQKAVQKKVLAEKVDVGFIFDGDADRVFLVTEQGNFVSGDIALLLKAKYFLKKEPGAAIAYNLICSRIVPEKIRQWGGRPLRTPVGFVNVSEALRKNHGVMGGENSAHYCFRDNYYADSGLIVMMTLLEIISTSNQKISALVKTLNPYFKQERYFEIQHPDPILARFKDHYATGQQDELDGLTVQYPDWWFNARSSNTEPLLRLTAEAINEKLLYKKLEELTVLISKFI